MSALACCLSRACGVACQCDGMLDGLGVAGAGAHTLGEYIEVDSLAYRGKLMAGLLATLA